MCMVGQEGQKERSDVVISSGGCSEVCDQHGFFTPSASPRLLDNDQSRLRLTPEAHWRQVAT